MPAKPYFHGGEDFYLQDGALIASVPPGHNRHGTPVVGLVKVLTTDRRYQLGHAVITHDGTFHGFVCAEHRTDRRHNLTTLDELVRACREVYGPRPRYAITAP